MQNNDIKILIKILEESEIDELEVSTFWGRQKIRLRKSSPLDRQNIDVNNNMHNVKPINENIPQDQSIDPPSDKFIIPDPLDSLIEQESRPLSENTITIKAPLVGTFYNSPKPNTPPFISVGDSVKEGQIICIIEAMKIFNEIESEYSGKIIKILVDDGTPVEFDQDLLVISP